MTIRTSLSIDGYFGVLLAVVCCGPPAPDPDNPGDEGVLLWEPSFAAVPERAPCGVAKLEAVRASDTSGVLVDCNLTLGSDDRLVRPLVLAGEHSSGVVVDCRGATLVGQDAIVIRSREVDGVWEPVHDVLITDCVVSGSVRVHGIGVNGGSQRLLASSHTAEHVKQTRDAAPYNVTLRNLVITGRGRVPLYLAVGVHHVTVEDSVITADADSALLYLDAESCNNTIRRNTFDGSHTLSRLLALDGSSYNTVRSNTFTSIHTKGVELYRNCGEHGVVRHATPSYNHIRNNVMRCSPVGVGLYIGSRDGRRGYCDEDDGWPYGSSISNYDHARFNRVHDNTMRGCTTLTGNYTNKPNYFTAPEVSE